MMCMCLGMCATPMPMTPVTAMLSTISPDEMVQQQKHIDSVVEQHGQQQQQQQQQHQQQQPQQQQLNPPQVQQQPQQQQQQQQQQELMTPPMFQPGMFAPHCLQPTPPNPTDFWSAFVPEYAAQIATPMPLPTPTTTSALTTTTAIKTITTSTITSPPSPGIPYLAVPNPTNVYQKNRMQVCVQTQLLLIFKNYSTCLWEAFYSGH